MAELTEGMVQNDKDGTIYRFYSDTVRNDRASDANNRPIFDEVLMVEIITPGQRNSTPKYELKRKWAAESKAVLNLDADERVSSKYHELRDWVAKYEATSTSGNLSGTPLKEWNRIDRGLAATYAASNIYTVEQLANVPDSAIDVLGIGGRELREQARAFLEVTTGGAIGSTQAARIGQLEREVNRLQGELNAANDLLRQYAAEKPGEQPRVNDSNANVATGTLGGGLDFAPPPPITTPAGPADSGLGALV